MKTPNWQEWRHIPTVFDWQAVALSMDIEPNSLTMNTDGWMVGPTLVARESFPDQAAEDEFESRRRVLQAKMEARQISVRDRKIDVRAFVDLALQIRWAMPSVLAQMGSMAARVIPQPPALPMTLPTPATVPSQLPPISNVRPIVRKGAKPMRELDAEIEAAKKDATDPNNYHSVWIALREIALNTTGPFSGHVDAAKGLEYTNEKGRLVFFTKDALRKRMVPSAR